MRKQSTLPKSFARGLRKIIEVGCRVSLPISSIFVAMFVSYLIAGFFGIQSWPWCALIFVVAIPVSAVVLYLLAYLVDMVIEKIRWRLMM